VEGVAVVGQGPTEEGFSRSRGANEIDDPRVAPVVDDGLEGARLMIGQPVEAGADFEAVLEGQQAAHGMGDQWRSRSVKLGHRAKRRKRP